MPKTVTVTANPNYRLPPNASAEMKADWEAIKKSVPVSMPFVTATENVRNSQGMYAIRDEEPVRAQVAPRRLEDMDLQELKLAAISVGVTLGKKQVKRTELVALVRRKIDEIEVVDDEGDGAEG